MYAFAYVRSNCLCMLEKCSQSSYTLYTEMPTLKAFQGSRSIYTPKYTRKKVKEIAGFTGTHKNIVYISIIYIGKG